MKALRLPALARLRPHNPRCHFDMVGTPPERTQGDIVPRIVVEDLEPCDEPNPMFRQSLFNGITGDSDTESNVSEDSPEEFSEKRHSEPATTSAASSHPEDEEKSKDHQDGPGVNTASYAIPALNFKSNRNSVNALFSSLTPAARYRPKLMSAMLDKKQKPASPTLT